MPEDLIYDGIVDELIDAGYGDRVIGLTKEAAFIEGDKVKAKTWMKRAGVPVAPFEVTDAKDLQQIKGIVTKLHTPSWWRSFQISLQCRRQRFPTCFSD